MTCLGQCSGMSLEDAPTRGGMRAATTQPGLLRRQLSQFGDEMHTWRKDRSPLEETVGDRPAPVDINADGIGWCCFVAEERKDEAAVARRAAVAERRHLGQRVELACQAGGGRNRSDRARPGERPNGLERMIDPEVPTEQERVRPAGHQHGPSPKVPVGRHRLRIGTHVHASTAKGPGRRRRMALHSKAFYTRTRDACGRTRKPAGEGEGNAEGEGTWH
jgi:hypothetical protein